jgi:hypothetical protein
MTLFALAYLITGGAMAYFCQVRSPLAVLVSVVFWPIVAAMVLIDMASDREAG